MHCYTFYYGNSCASLCNTWRQKIPEPCSSYFYCDIFCIRYNAIAEGLLTKKLYPFGKKKYEIPTGTNIKKALTLSDISLIYYYKPSPASYAEMSKDFWIFMYLCNGLNVKDMCLLKYVNIQGEVLEFERAKTARTERKVEAIRVALVHNAIQRDIISFEE